MKGLMMDYPLTVTSLMRHVEAQHGGSEVCSLTVENPRTGPPMPASSAVAPCSPTRSGAWA